MSRALRLAALLLLVPAPAFAETGGEAGFVWEIVNLALLLVVLVYFARKPVLTYLADRRRGIEQNLESSAKLLSEAESRLAEWSRRADGLDAELASIRESTRKSAEAQKEAILADARASADRIRESAAAVVERELLVAREQLREEAADLAVQLAARILSEQVTDADRQRLVDEFIAKVEREDA